MNHHIPNSLLNGVFFFYYGFFYSLAIGGLGLTTGLLFKEFWLGWDGFELGENQSTSFLAVFEGLFWGGRTIGPPTVFIGSWVGWVFIGWTGVIIGVFFT